MDKLFAAYYGIVNIYEQLYKKHLKKQYAGKPTKKYLRLTSQIKKVERIPVEAIERIMMF